MKLACVFLAGGKGTRYGERKQDVDFMGKPLWRYAYDTVSQIISPEYIVRVGIDVEGGETRTMSVYNGLMALHKDTDRVLIVEAARPLVTKSQLLELASDNHDSVSFVRPLVNTVIKRDGEYLNRSELYDLLTPQAFNYPKLLNAFQTGNYLDYTDETRIMFEHHGIKPYFIETGSNLFKVTYPGDLDIIESIYTTLLAEGKM